MAGEGQLAAEQVDIRGAGAPEFFVKELYAGHVEFGFVIQQAVAEQPNRVVGGGEAGGELFGGHYRIRDDFFPDSALADESAAHSL